MSERVAEITRKDSRPTAAEVDRYCYSNYRVTDVQPDAIWIRGEDSAGFTLDAIMDRMRSGLIFPREVTGDPEAYPGTSCGECGAWISDMHSSMVNADHDESCSLHPASVVTPEDEHPADCDGTVEGPREGFGGQPVTGTCQHPSHVLAGESKAAQDVVRAAWDRDGMPYPAIIGTVNADYRIIAAVPTDEAARNFVVCGVATDGRRDKAVTWRLDVADDGTLCYWSGDYYADSASGSARDVAMADMLTRANLTTVQPSPLPDGPGHGQPAAGKCKHRCMQGRNCGGCGCEGCGFSKFYGDVPGEPAGNAEVWMRGKTRGNDC